MKSITLLRSQSSLASLILAIKDALLPINPEQNLEPLSFGYLKSQSELLHSYFTNFCENHQKLATRTSAVNDPYFTDNRFAITESNFTQTISYIYKEINRIENRARNDSQQAVHIRSTNHSHLPKINLPSL